MNPKLNANNAYSDAEITAVTTARNNQANFTFARVDGNETGILTHAFPTNPDDPFVRNKQGGIVIQLPAVGGNDRSTGIQDPLEAQLANLKKLHAKNPNARLFPAKILFPYRLQGWHWNAGEIEIGEDGQVSGCAYDSYGHGSLSPEMQKQISATFQNVIPNPQEIGISAPFSFYLAKKSPVATNVQTGVACGLYAARALFQLITGEAKDIWNGIFVGDQRRLETTLRSEDLRLVHDYNPQAEAAFCAPTRDLTRGELERVSSAAQSRSDQEAEKFFAEKIAPKMANAEDCKTVSTAITAALSNSDNTRTALNSMFESFGDRHDLREVFFTTDSDGSRGGNKFNVEHLEKFSNLVGNRLDEVLTQEQESQMVAEEDFPTASAPDWDESFERNSLAQEALPNQYRATLGEKISNMRETLAFLQNDLLDSISSPESCKEIREIIERGNASADSPAYSKLGQYYELARCTIESVYGKDEELAEQKKSQITELNDFLNDVLANVMQEAPSTSPKPAEVEQLQQRSSQLTH